jgi:hypothetical protein
MRLSTIALRQRLRRDGLVGKTNKLEVRGQAAQQLN